MTAGAGIKRTIGPRRRSRQSNKVRRFCRIGDFCGNLLAGAKAGIGQALVRQRHQGAAIGIKARRLPQHRLFPVKTKPGQILENRGNEFLPRAALIQILDPENGNAGPRLRRSGRQKHGPDAAGLLE